MTTTNEQPDAQESNNSKPEVFNISKEEGRYKLTRRDFVKIGTVTTGAVTLMSCKISDGLFGVFYKTPTNTPTSTPTNTPTPTPTTTPTSTPEPIIGVANYDDIFVMSGPGMDYQYIASLYTDMTVTIIGLSYDGEWFKILASLEYFPELEGTEITQNGKLSEIEGWVETNSLNVIQGVLDNLPLESAPPPPTPMPNEEPTGDDGISYEYTDQYGQTSSYSLPCGSQIPEGSVCTCNCVSLCSCNSYVAPCSCDTHSSGGSTCTCNSVSYWYPN